MVLGWSVDTRTVGILSLLQDRRGSIYLTYISHHALIASLSGFVCPYTIRFSAAERAVLIVLISCSGLDRLLFPHGLPSVRTAAQSDPPSMLLPGPSFIVGRAWVFSSVRVI